MDFISFFVTVCLWIKNLKSFSLVKYYLTLILAQNICNNEYCRNFGNCEQHGPDAVCDCRHGFGGVACEDGNY